MQTTNAERLFLHGVTFPQSAIRSPKQSRNMDLPAASPDRVKKLSDESFGVVQELEDAFVGACSSLILCSE